MYIIIVIPAKGYPEQYVYNDKGMLTYYDYLAKKFFYNDIPNMMAVLYSGKPPYSVTIREV